MWTSATTEILATIPTAKQQGGLRYDSSPVRSQEGKIEHYSFRRHWIRTGKANLVGAQGRVSECHELSHIAQYVAFSKNEKCDMTFKRIEKSGDSWEQPGLNRGHWPSQDDILWCRATVPAKSLYHFSNPATSLAPDEFTRARGG
jgi:hypothetical protein